MVEKEIVQLTEDDVKRLAEQNGWQGSGTKDDPIIPESVELFENWFQLTNCNLVIKFRDFNFEYIDLTDSANLMFDGCRFDRLIFFHSSESSFERCDVSDLVFKGALNNIFKSCKIHNISNFISSRNRFINCSMAESEVVKLRSDFMDFSQISKIITPLLVIFSVSLVVSVILWILFDYINLAVVIFQLIAIPLLVLLRWVFSKTATGEENIIVRDNGETQNSTRVL